MKRHGADMLWKVGTWRNRRRKKRWNEGDTGRRIETNIFTYKHAHAYKHASHNCDFTRRFFTAPTLLHTIPFTHKHCYTQTLLHTNAFTQTFLHTCFYTQPLLHTDPFTHKRFYTQPFYTQTLLHTDTPPEHHKKPSVFHARTSFPTKRLPRTLQNRNFTVVFDARTSFRAKELPRRM